MFKKFLALAAAGSLLVHSLAFAKDPPVQPTHVEVLTTQPELAVDVPDTGGVAGAAVGGILGALIGAAINKAAVANAEERVGELRNNLVDYRFNERFKQQLAAKIAATNLAQPPQVEYLDSVRGADQIIAAGAQARTNLLFLAPRYAIASNFESLTVSITATTLDRSLKSNGKVKEKPRAYRTYSYRFPMKKIMGSGATEDAARWVALGGADVSAMLDEGIDHVTSMVAYDLTADGLADQVRKGTERVELAGKTRTGRWIEPVAGKRWLRNSFAVEGAREIDGVPTQVAQVAPAAAAPVAVEPAATETAVAATDAPVAEAAPVAVEPVATETAVAAAEAPVAAAPAIEAAPAAESAEPVAPVEAAPVAEPATTVESSQ